MFPSAAMNITAGSTPVGDNTPMPEESTSKEQGLATDPEARKRWAQFRQRIDTCKIYRKKLIRNWIVNIDYRRGKTFMSQPDDDTIAVNLDWSYTKAKQAALFSQVPKIYIDHAPDSIQAGEWIAAYQRKLNDLLVKAGIEAAMEEVIPDCVNAAGFGAVVVEHETLTQKKKIPSIDVGVLPQQLQMEALQKGTVMGHEIPMSEVDQTVDSRYTIRRISPSDFLWPINFTGSNFNTAPWIGRSGRLPWEEAKSKFDLTEEDRKQVQVDQRTVEDLLAHEYDREHLSQDSDVGFDEIFYYGFQYDPDAPLFGAIHHLVFLHGKTEPVKDEPWKGQEIDTQNQKIVGCTKRPIQVLTLTYITDEDIPPSDSAIGRSQVNELNKGRTHMNKQRARSMPASWFDVNRVDPAIQSALMRGIWNHSIPVQGDGSKVIGTIQQPTMAVENFKFDSVAKQDLQELWTIGSNQLGSGGDVETKGESESIQNNFNTRVTRERAKVASFVANIAEILGGLMCLYEDPKEFGQGFDPGVSEHLQYSILPDSTVLLDANQKLDRLSKYLNEYAKSGWVNIEPILREITTLVGLDATEVIKKPDPQSPPPPNISLRLTGAQDMMNPLLLAFMLKTGQGPDPKLIDQAKQLIQSSVVQQQPQQPDQQGQQPQGFPTNTGEANPQMSPLPKINERTMNNPGQPPAPPQGGQK